MKITLLTTAAIVVAGSATSVSAQTVLFDFNNAPLHSSLPVDLTAGGITAHLSATGQGFSIQDTSAPVVPVGFTGRFVYPNSVFAADLLISFDHTLTAFSILYSPQELGCDDSATMRVTANMNGNFVGTNTKTATHPGTWPVDTLSCNFPQGFNSVVVHYDSRPPTCQDYGVIFLADDMRVTPASVPIEAFCFGDGSLPTACPCTPPNTVPDPSGAPGHGCANSFDLAGAVLSAAGSLSPDFVQFTGTIGPSYAGFGFLVKGNAQSAIGIANGDGVRCVDGALIRFGGHNAGTNGAPTGTWTYPNTAQTIPVTIATAQGAGQDAWYQLIYRNAAAAFCSSGTTNWTNGIRVHWP